MDGGAWKAAVHGVAEGWTRLSDFTFTFYFHALEKEMATHSSVLAWRILWTGEPGGLLFMGSHRIRYDWGNLAAAAATISDVEHFCMCSLAVCINSLEKSLSPLPRFKLLCCCWVVTTPGTFWPNRKRLRAHISYVFLNFILLFVFLGPRVQFLGI